MRSKDCFVSLNVHAACDTCGLAAEPSHMPEKAHGFYCSKCCPACAPKQPCQ